MEYREAKRDCYCRSCDDLIIRGTKVIAMYSHRNKGQHIYLCVRCVNQMNELINETTN